MIVLLVVTMIFWIGAIPLAWAWYRAARTSADEGSDASSDLARQYYWATTALFFFGLFTFCLSLLIQSA